MHREPQLVQLAKRKKEMVVGLLDSLCQQIELSESQYQTAKGRYDAVGLWLSESTSPYLNQALVYPQGSVALGTAIKPLLANEFDVDLVCHLPILRWNSDASAVKAIVGNRLKEHATYKGMLEEKTRCWRINYANEFHLDITPSIINPTCIHGGELVPDKALTTWKPTNPKGYIRRFEGYAAIKPRFYLAETSFAEARAKVDPLPLPTMSKPVLKRIVQLLKRHRDQMFCGTKRAELAPISIIISTLAAWAYTKCATEQVHDDVFDLITAVIRAMPTFIRREPRVGGEYFVIENETAVGENFADKWNVDARLAIAFFEWHQDALTSVDSLLQIDGIDKYAEALSTKFGAKKDQVKAALASISDPIGHARSAGQLFVSSGVGLITSHAFGSVAVPKNTFYGQ